MSEDIRLLSMSVCPLHCPFSHTRMKISVYPLTPALHFSTDIIRHQLFAFTCQKDAYVFVGISVWYLVIYHNQDNIQFQAKICGQLHQEFLQSPDTAPSARPSARMCARCDWTLAAVSEPTNTRTPVHTGRPWPCPVWPRGQSVYKFWWTSRLNRTED